jgi:hypothetical protein
MVAGNRPWDDFCHTFSGTLTFLHFRRQYLMRGNNENRKPAQLAQGWAGAFEANRRPRLFRFVSRFSGRPPERPHAPLSSPTGIVGIDGDGSFQAQFPHLQRLWSNPCADGDQKSFSPHPPRILWHLQFRARNPPTPLPQMGIHGDHVEPGTPASSH